MKYSFLKIFISATIFLLLASSLASGTEPSNQQLAFEFNEEAVLALENQEFSEAIDLLHQALALSPNDKTLKNNLAVTYNNYALYLGERDNTENAKKYLYKAISIAPNDTKYKDNLANIVCAYAEWFYQKGNIALAEQELEESLKLAPQHVPSLILLGRISYQEQQLKKAKALWAKAYKYDSNNTDLENLLDKVTEEEKIESNLKHTKAFCFDIRFDKNVVTDEIYDIRFYLQQAYRDIGHDFHYYPKQKIPVILYSPEDFKSLRNAPDWVSGIYDGKIRLPIKENTLQESEMKRLIWHEYTHAIVFYLGGTNCPLWLNEGLAKWEEAKQAPLNFLPLKNALKENKLIPLNRLESCFSMKTDLDKINLAYLEAYSFTEFLLKRWNFHTIKKLLEEFKNGASTEEAFSKILHRSIRKMNKEWLAFLQDRYSK